MARRYKLVIAAAAVLSVLIAGAAVAATRALSPSQERQAVINDAARQLGVEPQELTDALKQALKNRVDAAVRDGRLTQEQATKLKQRIDAGGLPFFGLGPGPRFEFRHHDGPGLFHAKLEAAARYLGMTQAELREALDGGKTLAQVARDQGKSVDGLVDVLVAGAEQKLDRAVDEGHLTEAQKREMLSGLRERVTDLVNGRFPPRFDRWPGKRMFGDEPKRPTIF
jgi:outer membrane murein-binding lipoprotein Lpp